jgi:autotransporter-associated beta strand protein
MKHLLVRAIPVILLLVSPLKAQTILYQETYESPAFNAVNGWYGYWSPTAQNAQTNSSNNQSITSGAANYPGAGSYIYNQTASGGVPMNYFLFDKEIIAITPDDHKDTGLSVIWDRLGGVDPRFAIKVEDNWYVSDATVNPTGATPLNLLTTTWTVLDLTPGTNLSLGTSGLTYEMVLAGKTITNVGFYNNLTNNTTTRLNNLEIYHSDVSSYHWSGNGGSGGSGNWNTIRTNEWGGLWRNHRTAIFGGANDAGAGGTVTLQMSTGAADLRFESKANNYLLQGDATARTLTLTGNIHIDPNASVSFGNNLTVTHSNDAFSVGGGGTLILNNGSTLQTTGSQYMSIYQGSTVQVNTGATMTSSSSFIVGSTVTGDSGTATLRVEGGTVNSGANFILGNRTAANFGDVEVTINSGSINVAGNATNGLIFENTGTSSAVFNLDGGIVTTRRVLRSGTPSAGETTQFNFNGGVLRVHATGGSGDNADPNYNFLVPNTNLVYRVLGGGAKIDTNGRDVLASASLISAAPNDGGFAKLGEGILQLHGTNTYNGGTVIAAGTLSIQSNANLGQTNGGIEIHDNATLRVTSGHFGNRAIAIGNPTGSGTATIQLNSDVVYEGVISDNDQAGSLNKTGNGTLTLLNENTYTGKTTVSEGELALSPGTMSDGSITASPWIEVRQNARFSVRDMNDLFGPLAFTGKTLSGSGTFTGQYAMENSSLHIGHTSTGNQGLANLADAGDLTGLLTFEGDLALTNSNTYFQLGGTNEGAYDRLIIEGIFSADIATSLIVSWIDGFEAVLGNEFNLIDWGELAWIGTQPQFTSLLTLPEFSDLSLYWDTDDFFDSGIIRVAAIPEPSRALLLALALGPLLTRRRRC